MTTEEVQKQVAAWRTRNRTNLVDCPISFTMSRHACQKRQDKLRRVEHLRRGSGGGGSIPSDTCAECETLFEQDD
jgi:hypothetical protein